ncbi:tripartite tricarboxylate transporter TctB family protein [Teichococcus vastitatis]|jgi:putative tricarboxylic transport membrane protein|uniref:Tripartite tricarboxylate transporter TctB family protein n=1 Tax=Teichococcus vastitatis TaxID=2307076 RepID=A0ABS9W7V1_9PROT|nr:tripartite tricarboxylate transporter TctB family protein [Pseudoroseomonas vastitatis]MCI0755374.1 tripartite tricarboxylate transporter TctB family protein [Pseudoroseomonas vastitatis]
MSVAAHLGRDRRVALAVAGIAGLAFALTFTFDSVPAALMEGLGAAEFPRLICAILLLLAVVLFVSSPAEEAALPPVHRCTWWTLAACLGFFPVLGLIGMLPAMVLFPIVVGRLWGERRPAVLLLSAALVTLVIWLLFVRIFRFTLPGGLLGDALFG